MLKQITKFVFDLLFPVECMGCSKTGSFLCEECFKSININKVEPFSNEFIDEVHIGASFHQKLLRQTIHAFKYKYVESLSQKLSTLLINYYLQIENKLEDPIVICVPLHSIRLRERCFNQSKLLADQFANYFYYKTNDNLIIRTKNTKHQAALDKGHRISNMQNAFGVVDGDFIKDKNFIIIDDVYTTGSTVLEIARLLKENSAKKVIVLVVAKN